MRGHDHFEAPAGAERRVGSRPSSPSVRQLATAAYPEGPLWDPEGQRLLFVEYGRNAVSAWDPRTSAVERLWAAEGSGPSSLVRLEDPRARYAVAAYDAHALVLLDGRGGEVGRVTHDQAGERIAWPNDFAPAPAGGLYFTGSGEFAVGAKTEGKVYYWPKGRDPICVADQIRYSNGLAVTRDGRSLLVAEMFEDKILAFDIDPRDGTLSGRREFADLGRLAPSSRYADPYPLSGPDGMKVHPRDGRVFVAHHGTGRVLQLSAEGALEREIELPARYTTNVAFTPEARGLFVTAEDTPLGGVFRVDELTTTSG